MPTSCSRLAVCSRSRSRLAEPVFVAQLVEQPRGEHRDVPPVLRVEAEAVPERFGAGEHLVFEVLGGDLRLRFGQVDQRRPTASTRRRRSPGGRRFRRAASSR